MQDLKNKNMYAQIEAGFKNFASLARCNIKKNWKKFNKEERYAAWLGMKYIEQVAKNPAQYFSRAMTELQWKRRAAEYEATKQAAPAAAAKEETPQQAADETPVTGRVLCAPMGGTIVELHVKPGDTVKEGTPVLMYEAMKMQSELEAEFSGTVKRILVEPGQVIRTGEHLVEFEKK